MTSICLGSTQHGVCPTVVYSTANGRVSGFILGVFVAVSTYLTTLMSWDPTTILPAVHA